jgi:plastocyanin
MTLANLRRLAAGLGASAAFVAAVAAHAQAGDATVVDVQLSEFHFMPAEIELLQGRRYVLHVANTGGVAHDLEAKAFFRTVQLAPEAAARLSDGRIEVGKGETVDIAFTTSKPGVFEMHCTHPLHSVFGMKGKIVVR